MAVVSHERSTLPVPPRSQQPETAYELRVGSLTTAETVVIGTYESPGAYAAGHMFFVRGGNLMVQSFNEETLQLEGNPVRLGAQVRSGTGVPGFSVSANGRLVFLRPSGEPAVDLAGPQRTTRGDRWRSGIFGQSRFEPRRSAGGSDRAESAAGWRSAERYLAGGCGEWKSGASDG